MQTGISRRLRKSRVLRHRHQYRHRGRLLRTDSLAWTTGANLTVLGEDYTQIVSGINLLPPLPNESAQYTTGYNDQYTGVSGQTSFAKSMAISTGNQVADGSNVAATTNVQFIAVDPGRATRSEDLLVDGAALPTYIGTAILCPFAEAVVSPADGIPTYCNIAEAGSAFDTTLTSTVTSANDRFVGTDSINPVILNYNINAQGITLGDQSSPMIGSASAYLKVHVQEARNTTDPAFTEWDRTKAEDLAYSETSSASGLISSFGKSMSYQSGFNLI